MWKLRNFLRDLRYWFIAGWRSAWPDYYLDKQEEERRLIMQHSSDQSWSDEDVHQEFVEYVRDYDREMRLTRTWALIEEIISHRPAIKTRYTRSDSADDLP